MKLKLGGADAATIKADLLAVTVFENAAEPAGELRPATSRAIRALLTKHPPAGRAGKVRSLPAPAGIAADRLLVIGLGREGQPSIAEQARRAAGTLLSKMSEHGAQSAVLLPPAGDPDVIAAAAEGALLADHVVRGHAAKERPDPHERLALTLAVPEAARSAVRQELKVLEGTAAGTKLARDLGNEPSNILTPKALAKQAQALVRGRADEGLSCRVLGPKEIREKKMGAFLAVAQGSDLPPQFIHLKYVPPGPRKRGRRKVAIVGKGLTFDSGGISIKPSAGMEDMKMDMCGAAAVLGLFRALPALGVPHEVHGMVATCDNMPSGKAYKPGDVVTSRSGRTIEVLNTDAEGRLTLVDALTTALTLKPDVIVDLATLTGACAMALGAATGIMSRHEDLLDALLRAADAAGERSWPLPLFADYLPQLDSDVADIKNLGERMAGATTAGLFLSTWVPEDVPWAHLDIAGSAWVAKEQPYCPKGATGTGVRTLARWLRDLGD